ncbi:MAG: transposase [Patescibacteria group bacterium]
MTNRKVPFAPREYFHVYNRGNDKRQIFHDNSDYHHFLKLLFLANSENGFVIRDISKNIYSIDRGKQLVHIGAYCAMPNHFHLLVTSLKERGLSRFMQKFSTGLSMYYNTKHKRTGTLFEGRFKAEHVDQDTYLKYLFSYIHLNPVKLIQPDWKENGIKDSKTTKDYLRKYYFSSYLDYLNEQRPENLILNRASFPNYFRSKVSFEKEILDWISLKSTTEVRPL